MEIEAINHPNDGKRIDLIDIARFYGIVLVYYGHVIERIMNLGDPTSTAHYKFIYSFHMPLFFLLSGYISKNNDLPLGQFLKNRFASRIIPLIFFTLLLVVLSIFFSGYFQMADLSSIKGYLRGFVATAAAIPVFNIPTWFLFMLVSVEILHYFISPCVKNNRLLWVVALSFYAGGWYLNSQFRFFNPRKLFNWNFWYFHEAIVVYAFYLLGVFLRRWKGFEVKRFWGFYLPALLLTLLFVYFTYDLNRGPFPSKRYQDVMIFTSAHGNFFWFPVTAVAGCFMILFLARLTPPRKIILLLGKNALILFCLNGVFYHFGNVPAGKWIFNNLPHEPFVILGIGSFLTVLSLACCIPFVILFNKYIPQLVGNPKIKGPIFKNII